MLTEPQASVLRFIRETVAERGFPPSRAEIADRHGWASTNASRDVLMALERKGRIRLTPGVARGITVLSDAEAA